MALSELDKLADEMETSLKTATLSQPINVIVTDEPSRHRVDSEAYDVLIVTKDEEDERFDRRSWGKSLKIDVALMKRVEHSEEPLAHKTQTRRCKKLVEEIYVHFRDAGRLSDATFMERRVMRLWSQEQLIEHGIFGSNSTYTYIKQV